MYFLITVFCSNSIYFHLFINTKKLTPITDTYKSDYIL